MKTIRTLLVAVGLVVGVRGYSQINIPLSNVSLAFPSIAPLYIKLGTNATEYVLPTPFIFQGTNVARSATWFCIDPLYTIFYNGSGQPLNSQLHYASTNPADFDKWEPQAPGLTTARLQNLADLFQAYHPTTTNQNLGGALQLAVWEIATELDSNSFNLSTGAMQITSGGNSAAATMIVTAQSMLDSLNNVGVKNQGNIHALDLMVEGTYLDSSHNLHNVQGQVGFTPIPESSDFALGAFALIVPSVVVKLRRRQKTKTAAV